MPEGSYRILALTSQIAASYVGANNIDAAAMPGLIRDILRTLSNLVPNESGQPDEPREGGRPSVEVRKSVFPNHIVCLEDGLRVMMLKRHLMTAHRLTPEQYRAKWHLPTNYPMVAPNYARLRSRLAKETGLGHNRRRKTPPES
jgi:predicted transcriptional regulator